MAKLLIYDYQCDTCDYIFERATGMEERDVKQSCPMCGGSGERIPSATRFTLEGVRLATVNSL